jgi:hypothetical protein
MIESDESSFGAATRHKLVEEFVVSLVNGSLKPILAERNPATGKDVEYLMDSAQFDRIRKPEVWSYSNAVGTGYQYRVVYKDRRFSDLERLVGVYSGASPGGEDKAQAEQNLYQTVLILIKEGRLPKSFRIQSIQDAQEQKVTEMIEELSLMMDELGKRVKVIEEELGSRGAPSSEEQKQEDVHRVDAQFQTSLNS